MKSQKTVKSKEESGFTITEIVVATTLIGMLSAIAIPKYANELCRSGSAEAEATTGSIQSIIAAYIDETGVFPQNWDDLSSITAIMTNNGIASGPFTDKIILPSGKYSLAIIGPQNASYEIEAERSDQCVNRNIRACLDMSTGASDLKRGNGSSTAETPICS